MDARIDSFIDRIRDASARGATKGPARFGIKTPGQRFGNIVKKCSPS